MPICSEPQILNVTPLFLNFEHSLSNTCAKLQLLLGEGSSAFLERIFEF